MIPVTQIRRGMHILFEGNVCKVIDFHQSPGSHGAFVQVKLRDMKTGALFEHRYAAHEKVERAILEQHS